jgi:hypothetical protein
MMSAASHLGGEPGKGTDISDAGANANATPVVTASEDIKDEEEII